MIIFTAKSLPFTKNVYIAFRIALLETEERLSLAHQIDMADHTGFGYLTQVPFLKCVAPQVQLDLLLDFWNRYLSRDRHTANYLDESIVYSVCETASNVIRSQPILAERFVNSGPLSCPFQATPKLADSIQKLHLDFVGDGHFLMLSQIQDSPPEEAANLKKEFGLRDEMSEEMFTAIGRWNVSTDVENRAVGLLTPAESTRIVELFKLSMCPRKLSE